MNKKNRKFFLNAQKLWGCSAWDELALLKPDAIVRHPRRKEIALFIASAHQENNDFCSALEFINTCLLWGGGVKNIGEFLIAGIHISLGKIAALKGDEEEAEKNFLFSIKPLDHIDNELYLHVRTVNEMVKLDLLSNAYDCFIGSVYGENENESCDKKIDLLKVEARIILDGINKLRSSDISKERKLQIPSTKVKEIDSHQEDRKYFGLNYLDQKLELYIDYDNGFYVEIGANDGVDQSNTLYFEKNRQWTGVLIEPVLHNFLACKNNRSNSNYIVCAACVSFDYKEKYVQLHYANLMTSPEGLISDIDDPKGHADSGKKFNQCDVSTEILATAKTMSSILDAAKAPLLIDLLSLDVEGAEIEVLRGIDHRKYRFKFILVECRSLYLMEDEMKKNGYFLLSQLSHHDYLFKSIV